MAGKILGWQRLALAGTALAVVGGTGLVNPAFAATKTGPPGRVRAVAAQSRDHGALVSWRRPSSDGGSPVTGYLITASPGGAVVHAANVTSFLVGGLADGTAYRFTVAAVNKHGTGHPGGPSAPVTPRAATTPGKPRSVSVRAGFRQLSVSWAPPKSDGGAPVTGYRLTTSPATSAVSVAGDARSATLTGLADGKAYTVAVAAINSAGRSRAAISAAARPHLTVPTAPAEVTAAPAHSGIVVSWQPQVSDGGSAVTGYVITVAGTTRTVTTGPGARSATVTGLTTGTAYKFNVAAVNALGRGPAATSAQAIAGGTVPATTVVLSSASLSALAGTETNGSLVFTSPPAQVQNLAVGDIVVAGVSRGTPQGFMGEVTSVSTSGSVVTVVTVPASLDQALSAAGFGTSGALTRSQVAAFIPARRGVALTPSTRTSPAASLGSISLSLNTTLYKSSDGRKVTVDGDISLTPAVSFQASISCCVHTSSQFTGTVTASASLSVDAQVSHGISGGYTLGTIDFTPITIDVLGVPVVITPQLTVSLLASGSVSAGVTAGAGESVTLGAQVTTKDATASAHPIFHRTTTFTPPTVYGNLDVAAGAAAALSMRVDALPGPSLTDSLWLAKLSANPAAQPWWTLSMENVLHVHYQLAVLHHTFAAYNATLSDVTIRLAQATDPYQGITITPNPATAEPGHRIQLHAHVAGVTTQKVDWKAPPGNGTVTSGGLYTAPSRPGTYQVTARSPATGLKPGAVGLISIRVGDQPPGPPLGVTATSASYGGATITWQRPPDSGGGTVTAYTITAHPSGNRYPATGAATSDTIGGLTAGATYTFTITATSAAGTSIPSAPAGPVVIDNVAGKGGNWTVAQAPLPAHAATAPFTQSYLDYIACPSATSCVAIGGYQDDAGDFQGLLVTQSGSSWTAMKEPVPADASANPDPVILSLACASPTECAAVGFYNGSSGSGEPMLLTGGGASWAASTPPLLHDGQTGFGPSLSSVACTAALQCVAVGAYVDTSGNTEGALVTGSGNSWTAAEAPLPKDAATDPIVSLNSVACSSTACVAGGFYTDSSGAKEGLLLTGSGSSWTATRAPLPASAAASPHAGVSSVSCLPANPCVAAGFYTDKSDNIRGLLLTGSGTSWTAARAPAPPDEATDDSGYLLGPVTCGSASACVAVGSYGTSNAYQGMLVSGSGTSWTATQAPLPLGAPAIPAVQLSSVTCPTEPDCVAIGYYNDNTNPNSPAAGLFLAGSGTSWTPTQAPEPSNSAGFTSYSPNNVACPSASSCYAVGAMGNSAAQSQALLWTGSAVEPGLAVGHARADRRVH